MNWVQHAKARPVCSIGQLGDDDTRALNAAVRRGELVKRKAPFAGRLGAMKTYFAASNEAFDNYQAGQVAKFDLAVAMDNAADGRIRALEQMESEA